MFNTVLIPEGGFVHYSSCKNKPCGWGISADNSVYSKLGRNTNFETLKEPWEETRLQEHGKQKLVTLG
jgi:hypothetical protein